MTGPEQATPDPTGSGRTTTGPTGSGRATGPSEPGKAPPALTEPGPAAVTLRGGPRRRRAGRPGGGHDAPRRHRGGRGIPLPLLLPALAGLAFLLLPLIALLVLTLLGYKLMKSKRMQRWRASRRS